MNRVGRVLAAALAVPLIMAGCAKGAGPAAQWRQDPAAPAKPAVPLTLAITPKANAKGLPISAEVGVEVPDGVTTTVVLKDSKNNAVPTSLRDDKTSWVPDRPLKFDTTYTATVIATRDGESVSQTTTFTTMGRPGGNRVGTGLYLFDNLTYGVAMPVVVEFESDIPEKGRAGIERRMFVSTDPPQPGAWHWFGSRQALYRAPTYWKAGTRLTARIALDGHPIGNGRYGDMDRRATATIGRKFVMEVDNKTKTMSVFQDDKLLRKMPVSLGKPSTPSSSGTMVIMDRQEQTVFDTTRDPNPANRYRVDIAFAQRLTWGGQFIHAAPWSVGDQGVRNVSHGCVNLSTPNARWLFELTKIGDPVTVRGTEAGLEPGDGWTAWDLSWEEFLKGSALPHPEFSHSQSNQAGAQPEPTD